MPTGQDSTIALPGDRQVALRFARLTRGFWRGRSALQAWFWSLSLAAAIVLSVFANVTVNRWNGWFFDALEKRDSESALIAVAIFPVLMLIVAGLGVVILVTRETFQVHWRHWVTGRLADGWLGERRFLHLRLSGNEPANPEYRIADDVRWATEPLVDFAIGLLSAVITIVTFIEILWEIGGGITVPLAGGMLTIPAYLVLAAITYAVLVSGLITAVGRRLPGLIARRNESEARLRFALMRIRDQSDAIALSRSEGGERRAIAQTYDQLVGRWLAMVRQRGRLTWITNGSGALVPVVPLLLAAPKYFSGEMSLGGVVQVAAAFVAVQNAFNWLLDNFMKIAEWLAAARRVNELADALEGVDEVTAAEIVQVRPSEDGLLHFDDVTLVDREGRALLADLSLSLPAGALLHLSGDFGLARTPLALALTGLTIRGRGTIALPGKRRVIALPQRLHLPEGTLRDVLGDAGADLTDVLDRYGLGRLSGRLDEVRDWDAEFLAADRQRLALARADLGAPDILVLDEATNALETDQALEHLETMRRAHPALIIVALGQGAGFAEAATHRLALRRAGGVIRLWHGEGLRATHAEAVTLRPLPN